MARKKFIAVGDSRKLSESSDGITWASALQIGSTGIGSNVAVAYGAGRWVITSTAAKIFYSDSFEATGAGEWHEINVPNGRSIYGLAFGAGLFVGVTDQAQIYTSPDGITWTLRSSGLSTSYFLLAVTYDRITNQFIAVGQAPSGVGPVLTSPDGITWTIQTPPSNGPNPIYCVSGGEIMVAAGQRSDANKILTSPDGVTWTRRTNPGTWGGNQIFGVAYDGSQFVMVGNTGKIATSPDGITWTERTSGFSSSTINEVAFGAGLFVAVSQSNKIRTSPDGITWTGRTAPFGSDTIQSVAYAEQLDFTIDAWVFNTPRFTIDAHVYAGIFPQSRVFKIDAEVENIFAADGEVYTGGWVGLSGRNRHARGPSMHFGDMWATLVQLAEAVGIYDAGTDIETVLRAIHDRLTEHEIHGGVKTFTLDAYADLLYFWRDSFQRVVADGLGRSSGLTNTFGEIDWYRLSGGTMLAEVDNDGAAFTGTETSNAVSFVGYPTFNNGEILFDVYIPPLHVPTGWIFSIQPYRDTINGHQVFVQLQNISGWQLFATIGHQVTTFQSPVAAGWYSLRFFLASSFGRIKFWPADEAEPAAWDASGNFINSGGAPLETPRLRIESTNDTAHETLRVRNLRMVRYDTSVPPRRYQPFTIDAYVFVPNFTIDALVMVVRTGTLTINAIVRQTFSGSLSVDAYVVVPASSFTIDAIAKATITSSFTLDAYVPAGAITEGSLYGDWTYGEHLYGGGAPGILRRVDDFTIDAWITATRSASFTIAAYVGTVGESGVYGDHTLGTHEGGN